MPRRVTEGYGAVTIALHWLIALLILGVLGLGFAMTRRSIDPALQFSLFQWHKSFGMLALLLSLARLIHSLMADRVLPVEGIGRLEHLAAHAVHRLLLALAILVPLAGWAVASVSPLDIPTFAFNLVVIPHLPLPKSDAGEAWWTEAHAVLAYATLALVLLHSSAALYHHYWRRDAVLRRMVGSRAGSIRSSEKARISEKARTSGKAKISGKERGP